MRTSGGIPIFLTNWVECEKPQTQPTEGPKRVVQFLPGLLDIWSSRPNRRGGRRGQARASPLAGKLECFYAFYSGLRHEQSAGGRFLL